MKIVKIISLFLLCCLEVSCLVAKSSNSKELEKKTLEWYKKHPNSPPHWMTPSEEKRKDEIGEWVLKDPLLREKKRLIEEEGLKESQINGIHSKIQKKINAIIQNALKAPFPEDKSLLENIFVK